MCQNAEKCIDRASLLAFFIPFVLGGIWFSYIGLTYLNGLPAAIVSIYDRIYAVMLAFIDMGTTFGVASFTSLALVRQIKSLVKNIKQSEASLNRDS